MEMGWRGRSRSVGEVMGRWGSVEGRFQRLWWVFLRGAGCALAIGVML